MTANAMISRVQKRGQVTIPAAIRRDWSLQEGDVVTFERTADGRIVLTPQRIIALRALDIIGEALREQGVTLEQLIEDGRKIRGEIVNEKYGLSDDTET